MHFFLIYVQIVSMNWYFGISSLSSVSRPDPEQVVNGQTRLQFIRQVTKRLSEHVGK